MKTAWLAAARAALVLALPLFLPGCGGNRPQGEAETNPSETLRTEIETATAELFFAGPGDRLHSEHRELPRTSDPEERVFWIASAVVEGPTTEKLAKTFPDAVTIASVDLSQDGTVYVDLQSEEHARLPALGSRMELLTLYSLVNSIVHNVDLANKVVILWNGRQPVTFAGHIDTSRPLHFEPSLIARID